MKVQILCSRSCILLKVLPCLPTEYDAPYSLKSKYSVVIQEPLLLLIEKLVD